MLKYSLLNNKQYAVHQSKIPRYNDIHWGKLMEHIYIKIHVFLCIQINFIFNESVC